MDRADRPRVTSCGSTNHEYRWTVRRGRTVRRGWTLWRARRHGASGALRSLAGLRLQQHHYRPGRADAGVRRLYADDRFLKRLIPPAAHRARWSLEEATMR